MKRLLLLLFLFVPASAFGVSGDSANFTSDQGGVNWVNWLEVVDSAGAADNKYVRYTDNTQDWAGFVGFGFSLSAGSVVDTIQIIIEGHRNGGASSTGLMNAQLLKAGVGTGDIINLTLNNTTDTRQRLTGTTNTRWGTTWEASEVNAATFGVQIRDGNATATQLDIDHVMLRIVYRSFAIKRVSTTKATAGAPAAQNIVGAGFRPKAVIAAVSLNTGNGITASSNMSVGFGDAAGNEVAVWWSGLDAQGTGFSDNEIRKAFLYIASTGGGGVVALAVLDSMTADGCYLTWTTNNGSSYVMELWFIGGSEIDSTKCDTAKVKTTTGTQDYTGPGFQPKIVFFLGPQGPTALATQTSPYGARSSFGVATSASNEGCSAFRDEYPADPTNTVSWQGSPYSLALLHHQGDSLAVAADVSSMLSNGFRLNYTNVTGSAHLFGYLAIEGDAEWKMGFETMRTTAGPEAVAGLGFSPDGLLVVTAGDTVMASPATNTTLPHSRFWIGMGSRMATLSGYQGGGIGSLLENAQATSDYDRVSYTTVFMPGFNAISPASPSTDAVISSFDSDGFTLDYGTVFGTDSLREFMWIAGGAQVAAAEGGAPMRRMRESRLGRRDEAHNHEYAGSCEAVTAPSRWPAIYSDLLERGR